MRLLGNEAGLTQTGLRCANPAYGYGTTEWLFFVNMNVDDLLKRLRAEAELVAGTWGHRQAHQRQPWPPASTSGAFGSARAHEARAELQRQLLTQSGASARWWLADDADFVELLYRDMLNRTPDADGAQHWLARLQAGMPRLELWLDLYLSPERLERYNSWRTRLAARLQRFCCSILKAAMCARWRGAWNAGCAAVQRAHPWR